LFNPEKEPAQMRQQPRLSFWQIWNMSFGFLGIQFGFALQNANVSRIFESLGADVGSIPILWIAAPVTGLIVQPIIGYLSDNTWNRFGRRRPFFLIGAILASMALIIMPNSPYLWVAAGMLWMLDASINISMEPFRAFVGDMLPPEQRTKGFAMQSFFIGIGAVVASGLPYVFTNWLGVSNVANVAAGETIPLSVRYSFYLGAGVFFLSVLWTVLRTKEYSPEELASFEAFRSEEGKKLNHDRDELLPAGRFLKYAPFWILGGLLLTVAVYWFAFEAELYILTAGITIFGLVQLLTGVLIRNNKTEAGFVVVINDLFRMPKTMGQLAVVQFFSWFALFAMWIYTTAGVTSHIYDMKLSAADVEELQSISLELQKQPHADWFTRLERIDGELASYQQQILAGKSNVVASMRVVNFFREDKGLEISGGLQNTLLRIEQEYNKGADWVGVSFSAYNGFAALLAFFLPLLARWTNRRVTHMIALVAGALGFISIYFITDPRMIIVSMLGVGMAWASILSMPYAILTGSLPAHKMGTFMGIFNFFIVIPQILAASILGFFVATIAGGQAIYALILGGGSFLVAAITMYFVEDKDEEIIARRHQAQEEI
jgi:maltose/moltooligosaccharide transporter